MSRGPGGARGEFAVDGSTALARAAGQVGVAHFPVSCAHLAGLWDDMNAQGRQRLVSTIDDVSKGVEIASPRTGAGNGVDGPLGTNGSDEIEVVNAASLVRIPRAGPSISRRDRLRALIETINLESNMRTSGSDVLSETPLICAAVACCDVVVIEGHWADLLTELGVPERFNTKVFSSLADLVPYLMKLNKRRGA